MSSTKKNQRLLWLLFVALLLAMLWGGATYLPEGIDWSTAFRPAVWRLLRGEQVYGVAVEGHFYLNAPWALIPLIPLALLPEEIGRAVLFVVSILAFMYTANKLGAKAISNALLILSPPVLHGLLNGNIDWLATLGFVLPPQIGLFFISTKPQIGIAVGVYWLFDHWRSKGLADTLRVFAPFTITFVASLLIWGLWPLNFGTQLNLWWNASLWPYSIPFGLLLLGLAIYKRRNEFAMAASPLLSPYILFHSWVGALLAIIKSVPAMLIVFLGLWGLVIYRLLLA
jgi:hypothetical protein